MFIAGRVPPFCDLDHNRIDAAEPQIGYTAVHGENAVGLCLR